MLISLVTPVFNEEKAIPIFYAAVINNAELKAYELEIIFINDGSDDQTESITTKLAAEDSRVTVLHFSRNFGKEPALLAGISHATGDVVIPIDVDLQDPIEVIPELITKWQEGFDVVLAKRIDRSSDSFLKRLTSNWFYKLFNTIVNSKIESNVGDFRLLSRQVTEEVIKLDENNLFMKGLLSWVGFRTAVIEYSRPERVIGHTKFNFTKLLNLAVEGITSFSTIPLRFWSYLGLTIAFLSFIYAIIIIINKVLFGNSVAGYPSLMVAILFLGGIQLIGIGVLGEYIGRIYQETKRRPRYIIRSISKK